MNNATSVVIAKLKPLAVTFPNGRFTATATCDDCTKTTTWSANQMPQPDVVRKKIRDRKWLLNDKEMVCTLCTEARRAKAKKQKFAGPVINTPYIPPVQGPEPMDAKTKLLTTSTLGDPTPDGAVYDTLVEQSAPVAQPTPVARAAKRHAYELLLDNYDTAKSRYKADWSDQVIAEKTGYAIAAVAKLRDEDFGPAGPPPQLLQMKEELTRLDRRIATVEGKITQEMDELSTLQGIAQTLRRDFDRLVSVHGWEPK